MDNSSSTSSQPISPIPPEDPRRDLALARPDEDQNLPHISLSGGTYTILLTDQDTAGCYALHAGIRRTGDGRRLKTSPEVPLEPNQRGVDMSSGAELILFTLFFNEAEQMERLAAEVATTNGS